MKKICFLIAVAATSLLANDKSYAQCLQNGVPCSQTPATTGSPTPNNGTLVLGTDGTNSYPISTDSAGRTITSIYSLPAIPTGTNTIGSIANTGFNITGTLPGFTTTPTVNLGTLNGAATDTNLTSVKTTLGSPFQAGGSIGNTAFGISGTLPSFTTTPTFNLGTAPTLTTSPQGSVTTAAPSYSNGSAAPFSLTTSGALRVDTGGASQAVTGTVTANIGTTNGLSLDATSASLFKAGQSIGNTTFGASQSGTWNVGLNAGSNVIGTVATTAADGSNITLGAKTDVKCITTDATACSNTALLKGVIDRQIATVTALTSPTPAGTNIIGNLLRSQVFPETTAALAASATFTAPSHDSGVVTGGTPFTFFACFVFADKAGTAVLSGSNDNSTFYPIITQTITASTPVTVTTRVLFRYNRCAVTNTATLTQGTFVMNTQFGQ